MDSRRTGVLIGIGALAVVAAVAYVAIAALKPNRTITDARPRGALAHGELMVRAVDPSEPTLNGRIFALDHGRVVERSGDDLTCERVYYAAGHGLCLGVAPSGVEYTVTTFGPDLHPRHTTPLTGLPSRARVSSDGRYGAMTVFVRGDSYLESSTAFSTRTYIVEMASGKTIGQLEQFEVLRDGGAFDAPDFNFWGVTFDPHDSDRFFATLGTGGHHYLVEGSIHRRRMRVLRDGVECPSLSPDGTRIAFKSRIGRSNRWHLRVLDLATLDARPVAEKRSIDDQAEWLDDTTLVYSDVRNVYVAPADGRGSPRVLVRDAASPVRLAGGP
jgi:hypothetical protein